MGKEPETMLRFGTIGTGWIANSYVDGALDSGLWQLTAVYSRTKEKGLAFAAPYGVKTIFTDLEEIAATDKIDAVYIASPNKLHIEQARHLRKAAFRPRKRCSRAAGACKRVRAHLP